MAKRRLKISSKNKKSPDFLKGISAENNRNRKLIVIQLSGGNDGLNTVIPFRNDNYYKLRPNLSIAKNKTLSIDDDYGFNSVLSGMSELLDQGHLSIINAIGYPNPTRSHFKAIDIWQSASDSHDLLNTGWIGRYLDASCTPENSKSFKAIEINDLLHLALKGTNESGIAFENIATLHKEMSRRNFTRLKIRGRKMKSFPNDHLAFMYQTIYDGKNAVDSLYEKTRKVKLRKSSFPNSELGQELRAVSELILSDSDTEIYYLTVGSFDTHSLQTAKHSKLLKSVSDALLSTVEVLKKNGKFDETCIMLFSEFGRRVAENGSNGTDHGAGNNMFIISPELKKPGFYNPHPNLQNLINGDIAYEIDFRRVYATILEDWLGASGYEVLQKNFAKLDLFKTGQILA